MLLSCTSLLRSGGTRSFPRRLNNSVLPKNTAAARNTTRRRTFFTEKLVDNTGSIARDILATERTFLAWARTGLGFVGAGSALFAAYHQQDQIPAADIVPACTVLLLNGSFLLLFATRRYLRVIAALQTHNQFPINAGGTLTAVMVTAGGTVSSMALVAWAEMKASIVPSKGGKTMRKQRTKEDNNDDE